MSTIVFGLYFFTTATIASFFIACLRVCFLPWDPQGRVTHRLTGRLAFHYIAINPGWLVEFENMEYLKAVSTFIMVANHQSLLDVLVLSRLNANFKWVAKIQIMRMLGVGQLMHINQYVPVAHGDIRSVRRMWRRCRHWLQQGVSIFIFPEGERSFDGTLLPFKDGPFRLSCETNTPVLPVVIDGTREALPRGGWRMKMDKQIKVKLLPPVHPGEFDCDPKRLNAAVRGMIEEELQRVQSASSTTDSARPAVVDHAIA
jgi:1-acyl-sn-glycerol-3-phosphate acyltransferase